MTNDIVIHSHSVLNISKDTSIVLHTYKIKICFYFSVILSHL